MRSITHGESTPLPDSEAWDAMIQRVHVSGRINEINEETYWYFLEVLPPKWMGRSCFAFAEGQEALTFFWQRGGQYFCRRLTHEEAEQFCEVSGLSKRYGM